MPVPSSAIKLSSSGSDFKHAPTNTIDEKKRRRMISNRESARRSRMRKQKHMEDLIMEKAGLERKLQEDNKKYIALCHNHQVIQTENEVLRAEKTKLSEYLRYLLQTVENYKGMEANIGLQVSGQFSKAWQVGGAGKSVTASGALEI